MRDAVIGSTARTPIAKAYRGAFKATPSPTATAMRSAPRLNAQGSTRRSLCIGGGMGAAGLFGVLQ